MRREKSFWAWGWADRFPDAEGRRNAGQLLEATLGFSPPALMSPPTLDAISLRASRVSAPTALQTLVQDDPEARIRHTFGRGYRDLVRGFYGDFGSAPDLVAHPQTEEDVRRLLDWCHESYIAVVPFGGGTSVVGGVECTGTDHAGVLSLDLGALNAVKEVDGISRQALIQAGTFGPDLEAQLRPHGLTLRHFPQSFEHSTLGGWVATRAGGHFATLYTHIDELVASVRMLSPTGCFETRALPGSGAGPSPDRLVVGSEGALGVITEATMRVRARPKFKSQASLHFAEFESAVHATREIVQSGLHPTNCRLLDAREAALNMVAQDGTCVLIVAFESHDHALHAWLERAVQIGEARGGQVRGGLRHVGPGLAGPAEGSSADTWKSAFVDAPYLQSVLVSLGVMADTFETACSWSNFFELHRAVVHDVRAAMKAVAGRGTLTCRFTHVYPDGPAPYYTFIAPARSGQELAMWAEVKAAASEALLRHGGTITHHHAVGRVHRPWYQRQVPDLFLQVMHAAKQTLDPRGVLNPGALIPA